MRHSASYFWKTCIVCALSSAALTACGASNPSYSRTDPYDSYYGQVDGAAQSGSIIVNPSAPQTYVVQKGDTLWSVARKFLNTPWYWPEIWDKNQAIQNPHRLYPGDVLYFSANGGGNDGLAPQIRLDQRGSGEPISNLVPFLVWPRVLDEATIKNAPYVLASQDDHSLITEGETFYVNNLRQSQAGDRCAVFHPGKPLHHAKTGELLGYEVAYAGYSRIERIGAPSTAVVLDAKREIHAGDRLLAPTDDVANLANVQIHTPSVKVRADIAGLFGAEEVSGTYMIAAIDKGRRDNIQVGYTLGVYAQGRDVRDPVNAAQIGDMKAPLYSQLPPEKVANMVIYKVTDRVSYGLILDATREIRETDKIGNP